MLDRIPFGGTGGKMGDRDSQMKFIGQGLQPNFPQPTIARIRTACIGFNQQLITPFITNASNLSPH